MKQKIDWNLWDGKFMTAQCELGEWVLIEDYDTSTYIPLDDFSQDNFQDNERAIEFVEGFRVRLSANSYMDCTEWTVFDTEQEAFDYLVEYYPPESLDNNNPIDPVTIPIADN